MSLIRILLVSILGYLVYKMIRPLFISAAGQNSRKNPNREEDNIQKKYADKIEDADFEEIEE
ncbi:MAG TPA: hypothetical protein EYP36_05870 [Calditrichaeota bacterium]|nr:hypothetical protein [Calditrichota bacterium]